VEGTRRQLTVMFCDLVSSTSIASRLDPEEMSELLAKFQETCTSVIERHGGHVGRYVGDALLVFFGYPIAHEDDAQRAVQASLEIVEAIRNGDLGPARYGLALAVRIGIATGLVVVGDIGTGERRERAAIVGETPNLAARLQAIAEPNAVVIAPTTQQLVEGLFVVENLGPQALKGIPGPVSPYRVLASTDLPNRFEAKVRHGLSALIGRGEEIAILARRWRRAAAGEGQVVVISGEAGVGKSRLIQALKDLVGDKDLSRILWYCTPNRRDTPLYPIIEQLERGLRFDRRDSGDQKLDKLETVLNQLGLRVPTVGPPIARLLSVDTEGRYGTLNWTAEDTKKKTFDALKAVVLALASSQPVLMIIEDFHWTDASTLEFLNRLTEYIAQIPVLLVVAARPDFDPPWGDQPHVVYLQLRRLNRKESAAIIGQVTGDRSLPDEVLDEIIARTDGVPLFIEELTKTALEAAAAAQRAGPVPASQEPSAIAIPASLQESLLARLDRLAPVKEVAQIAAALGRSFTQELLAEVSRIAEAALDAALAKLVDAELIYRRGIPPDVVYEFKHALVQDVAYNSLLRNKRLTLHEEIAKTLTRQMPGVVDTNPEMLAHHYREAGMAIRAIPFAMKAGDLAAARLARVEATANYQSALAMARGLERTDDALRFEIDAALKLATVAAKRKHFERDLKNLARARTLATDIQDNDLLAQILYWIGRTNYVTGHFDAAIEFAEQSLAIAESVGAREKTTADPVNLLARIRCLTGEPKEAIKHGRRNLKQMHDLGNRIEGTAVAGVLSFAYSLHGRFPEALEAAERGVAAAQTLEHLPTLASCLMFRAVIHGWSGDLDNAVREFEAAIATSNQAGDLFRRYLSHGFLGEAYLIAGRHDAAEAQLTECLKLADQIGTTFHLAAFKAYMAEVLLHKCDKEAALELLEAALRDCTEKAHDWSRSIALRALAHTLSIGAPQRMEEADRAIRTAIQIEEQRECRCDLAWSRLVESGIAARRGDVQGAREADIAAKSLFEEIGVSYGARFAPDAVVPSPESAAAIQGG
jgi:predicted ATPase/class 3 adenylate cyclase